MNTTSEADARQPLMPRPRFSVHDKQAEVLASDARYRTLCWGRRAGKNICAVIDLIEYGRAPWLSPWGSDDPTNAVCWWVGPTYTQAKKYGFDKMLSALPDSWIEDDPKRSEPYEIELINGLTYEFRTYDKPESLQGGGVDREVIDEADYMPRSLWDNDLEPMLMDTRGSVMFISKPRRRGWYHEMYERGTSDDFPDHESFHATSADNPFIDEDPADKRGEKPERVFKQEYLAEFVDESGGVFTKLDNRLFTTDYDIDAVDGEPPYRHGWDFARHEDWTVGFVLDATGRIVHYDRVQKVSWPQIQTLIEQAHAEYEGVLSVDATRDNKIVSDLADAGLTVEPVSFTPKRKRELIDDLTATIENGELTAPDIPQLRHELELFEYDVTPAGNVRYGAPEGFHDDCVDALALANGAPESAGITRTTGDFGAGKRSRL